MTKRGFLQRVAGVLCACFVPWRAKAAKLKAYWVSKGDLIAPRLRQVTFNEQEARRRGFIDKGLRVLDKDGLLAWCDDRQ